MQQFGNLSSTNQVIIKKYICRMMTEGLGYKRIRKELAKQNVSVSLGTLSYWCKNETKRFRSNSFEAKPGKEISYFIGVMFSDGCASKDTKNYDYCLLLGTIDKEFAEKFSECISKLLNKDKNYPVHSGKNNMF
jgi:hypothetical protein